MKEVEYETKSWLLLLKIDSIHEKYRKQKVYVEYFFVYKFRFNPYPVQSS